MWLLPESTAPSASTGPPWTSVFVFPWLADELQRPDQLLSTGRVDLESSLLEVRLQDPGEGPEWLSQ